MTVSYAVSLQLSTVVSGRWLSFRGFLNDCILRCIFAIKRSCVKYVLERLISRLCCELHCLTLVLCACLH